MKGTVTVRGQQFPFNVYEMKCVKRLDEAQKALVARINIDDPDVSSFEDMTILCDALCAFFDDVLGDGAAKRMFGEEEKDIIACLDAYYEFKDAVEITAQAMVKAVLDKHRKYSPKRIQG